MYLKNFSLVIFHNNYFWTKNCCVHTMKDIEYYCVLCLVASPFINYDSIRIINWMKNCLTKKLLLAV